MGKKKIVLTCAALAVVAMIGTGCSYETGTQGSEAQKQEDIQSKLVNAVPVPEVTNSTTREALSERTKLFDDQNKISYIYLISYGKVMAFYTVKGQVVSLRSYLTPMENIVNQNGVTCKRANSASSLEPGCGTSGGYVVQTADVDGTYGDNVDGVFFFTTDGAYVEWKGDYMVSDQPLQLSTPAELVRSIK